MPMNVQSHGPRSMVEPCFSLTVVSSDLPAGYLGRSLEPLTAGACHITVSAGDETKTLDQRQGATPQWNAKVRFTQERHVPPQGVYFEVHQHFHCATSGIPLSNVNEALQPDRSVTWRASLSANQIRMCNHGEEVKIMLVDPKGRLTRASVNVVFSLPADGCSDLEELDDRSEALLASTGRPRDMSQVPHTTPPSIPNASNIPSAPQTESMRDDDAQGPKVRGKCRDH